MRERHNLSKLPSPVKAKPAPLPRLNGYVCQRTPEPGKGRHVTVTVDVADGVTPFMIGCPACNADAHSMFYPTKGNPPPLSAATYEWYKPDADEVAQLHPAEATHVKQGGLLMRPRTEAPPVFHS